MEVGVASQIPIELNGGAAPEVVGTTGLPEGCALVGAPWAIDCMPIQPGATTLSVLVRDAVGNQVRYSTSVWTFPPLRISPVTAGIGNEAVAEFRGVAVGGAPPISWEWVGSPNGCGSSSDGALVCSTATPGTYPILLWARDRLNASSVLDLNVTIPLSPLDWIRAAPVLLGAGVGVGAIVVTVTFGRLRRRDL